MNKYFVKLDKGKNKETEIFAKTDHSAIIKAIQWIKEEDWFTFDNNGFSVNETIYVFVSIKRSDDNFPEFFDLRIDPPEPKCIEEKHDWEKQYWSIISNTNEILEQCNKCKIFKKTTWKSNYNLRIIQYFK
jgi:hypothetical protein